MGAEPHIVSPEATSKGSAFGIRKLFEKSLTKNFEKED